MISYARQNEEKTEAAPMPAEDHIAPVPRVSIQAFCETVEIAAAVQSAGEDRRLGKAHLKIQMGGIAAAIEFYRTAPTPNLIMLEADVRTDILAGLDHLATVCDPGTKVVVIGHVNDVELYRELIRRGVSEYLVAPVDALDVIRTICSLFSAPEANRSAASSPSSAPRAASAPRRSPTMSPGRSPAISRATSSSPTSTSPSAPPASTSTRIRRRASPRRCSRRTASTTTFLDRLLAHCSDHLSLLAAPATLDRAYDFDETRSSRSSTRCARPTSRRSSSTCRISGRPGPARR